MTLFLLPFVLLGVSRLGAELFVGLLPLRVAWIPALLVYYAAIEGVVLYTRRALPAPQVGSVNPGGRPAAGRLLLGLVLPALLPSGFFVLNAAYLPPAMFGAIVLFALVNGYFEEVFWRGMMAHLPASNRVRILYSGALFSLSHWFFTGAYWLSDPRVLTSVVITTFVMGLCWMWFYLKERRLGPVIASHVVVDVLNLSVAMFMGVPLGTV